MRTGRKTCFAFLGWLWTGTAVATTPRVEWSGQGAQSTTELIRQLSSSDRAVRLLAARSLRTEVRANLRLIKREHGILSAAALVQLDDFDRHLAPVCIARLEMRDLTRPCADILRLLETEAALPAIDEAIMVERRTSARKRLEKAARAIREAE